MPDPVTLVAVGGLLGLTAHLARRYFEFAKAVVDVVLGVVALVLFGPLMGLCAVLIKWSDGGPVIYTQIRVGKGGRLFRLYKMRTMYVDAESRTGAVWARHRDPRILPMCRWMRLSHVDELPQLINVIKGEMSLVGPRPERPEILDELEKVYPDVRRRLAVRPGITGLAQVTNGYDTSVEGFRHKLRCDLEYIERRRWSLEIRILAATLSKFHDRSAK
ncbi:MAG: sugar transferase [Phycisphaerae bacterium]|nr:sugar transferase [Phycisphaerae bacterium]